MYKLNLPISLVSWADQIPSCNNICVWDVCRPYYSDNLGRSTYICSCGSATYDYCGVYNCPGWEIFGGVGVHVKAGKRGSWCQIMTIPRTAETRTKNKACQVATSHLLKSFGIFWSPIWVRFLLCMNKKSLCSPILSLVRREDNPC